jgi:hypothetical protein
MGFWLLYKRLGENLKEVQHQNFVVDRIIETDTAIVLMQTTGFPYKMAFFYRVFIVPVSQVFCPLISMVQIQAKY